jgi:hypothetical protein
MIGNPITPNTPKMEKAKSVLFQLAICTTAVLIGLKVYEKVNKPKVLPPATAPATAKA